jgi:RNA polymerase sigma-70 factor (ECF subfamily)
MHPEATAELIERARTDRAAFGELYDLYVRRVYAFCLANSKDRDEAEDLTAQTFERALNAIGRYEHRGAPLSSWLFRIAGNLLIDRGRSSGRVVLLGDQPVPEQQVAGSPEPLPEQWVEQWERAAWLRDKISSLPPDQQQAVRLRFWEGLSVAEVADRMGRNENSTKQLLFRAMTTLRTRIAREGGANV